MEWGLLGPEMLESTRRTRSLGLASVVRHYNELAVPSLGNVWFIRQIYLALLGIVVANEARAQGKIVSNIEVTNALEALGCWLALSCNGWTSDARLRGSTKLAGRQDLSFASLRRRSAYVTQPMRMAAVQPLPALGLVEAASERFNAYVPTEAGRAFIKSATEGIRPWRQEVVTHLIGWVGGDNRVESPECVRALSPLEATAPPARAILENQLLAFGKGAHRRAAVVAWARSLRQQPKSQAIVWSERPAAIDSDHWRDLESGARFFLARDEALAFLDQVEAKLDQSGPAAGLPLAALSGKEFLAAHARLQDRCRQFLDLGHDVSPSGMAGIFCAEGMQRSAADVIRSLVARDGQVLRLSGDVVRPGPAFRFGASAPEQGAEEEAPADSDEHPRWPAGISWRVPNLFYLSADLDGELEDWREMRRAVPEVDDER